MNIIVKKIGKKTKQISVVWIKSVYFSEDLSFENQTKQHINICSQSQTNECRNNQWLLLELVCRQTSVNFTEKTVAVYCNLILRFLAFLWIYPNGHHICI